MVGRLDHGVRTIFDLDAVLKIIGSMRLRGYHGKPSMTTTEEFNTLLAAYKAANAEADAAETAGSVRPG